MTETIASILQWLLPGGGMGAVMIWITSRKLRTIRVAKEEHDTYKQMYQDVSNTLLEFRTDYERLQKSINKLERAISKAHGCHYRDICPILRSELQNNEKPRGKPGGTNKQVRQPLIRDQGENFGSGTGGEGVPEDSDAKPPQASSSGELFRQARPGKRKSAG